MGTEQNQPDSAVDKFLAALRDAAPPEGMETRIAQRLADQSHTRQAVTPRWRDLFAGTTLAGAWGRGALSGVAVAILAIGGARLIQHQPQIAAAPGGAAVRSNNAASTAAPIAIPVSTSPHSTPAAEPRATPCVTPTTPRTRNVIPAPTTDKLLASTRDDTAAPSHPAPALALTAQERGLVRLVRTTDPKDLATLNSETEANLQARDEADFAKFFAPPAPPPAPKTNE